MYGFETCFFPRRPPDSPTAPGPARAFLAIHGLLSADGRQQPAARTRRSPRRVRRDDRGRGQGPAPHRDLALAERRLGGAVPLYQPLHGSVEPHLVAGRLAARLLEQARRLGRRRLVPAHCCARRRGVPDQGRACAARILARWQVAALRVAWGGAGQHQEGNRAYPRVSGRHHPRSRPQAIRRPRVHVASDCCR